MYPQATTPQRPPITLLADQQVITHSRLESGCRYCLAETTREPRREGGLSIVADSESASSNWQSKWWDHRSFASPSAGSAGPSRDRGKGVESSPDPLAAAALKRRDADLTILDGGGHAGPLESSSLAIKPAAPLELTSWLARVQPLLNCALCKCGEGSSTSPGRQSTCGRPSMHMDMYDTLSSMHMDMYDPLRSY